MYLMEMLSTYQKVNLPAIVIEYFNTIMTSNDGKHGLTYYFWLNRAVDYFNVECDKAKAGSMK